MPPIVLELSLFLRLSLSLGKVRKEESCFFTSVERRRSKSQQEFLRPNFFLTLRLIQTSSFSRQQQVKIFDFSQHREKRAEEKEL